MKLTNRYRERFRKIVHRYQGSAVGFRCDEVKLPHGGTRTRQYLTHPGAVAVLALTPGRKILLIKQFRYPVGEFTYEIPAGKLAPGEAPAACVRRELEEEAGYQARRVVKILSYWPTPAFSNEVLHIYIADKLVPTHTNPDDDEFLEILEVSPATMEKMIRTGRIRDSKTLIAYLAWAHRTRAIR